MNREQILQTIRELAKSKGFYGRFLEHLENDTEENREKVLTMLEAQKFKYALDLILFLEG